MSRVRSLHRPPTMYATYMKNMSRITAETLPRYSRILPRVDQAIARLVHPHIHARALKRQWLMRELQVEA